MCIRDRGSPVLHSFRMPQGLDYIKLPCLGRDRSGKLSAKYLDTAVDETVKLRSHLMESVAANFKPDLLLVDKKPYGLLGELKATLNFLNTWLPQTKRILLLRDILDSPEATIKDWQQHHYYQAIDRFYDRVLVVGMPEIFDLAKEYQFPETVSQKVRFCGYIRKEYGRKLPQVVRRELQVKPDEQLVLVTPGGGGDGYRLIEVYLQGLAKLQGQNKIKTLIISGPEMPADEKNSLDRAVEEYPQVIVKEFTDDPISYMEAADTVVSMGGYNTVSEILSLSKRAVVVPRTQPVQEQWIRAERMAEFGLFKAIHPDRLTPEILADAVLEQLNSECNHLPVVPRLDLNALPRIQQEITQLLFNEISLGQFGDLDKVALDLNLVAASQ
ncbi:MAG: glycosyltransferase family protein, partial [Spirulina sp.]